MTRADKWHQKLPIIQCDVNYTDKTSNIRKTHVKVRMPVDLAKFWKLESKYCMNPMNHEWPEDRKLLMRAIKDYGYGGVVTNVLF